jgi:hypothetical protein
MANTTVFFCQLLVTNGAIFRFPETSKNRPITQSAIMPSDEWQLSSCIEHGLKIPRIDQLGHQGQQGGGCEPSIFGSQA